MGKGTSPRPYSIGLKEFDVKFEDVFGRVVQFTCPSCIKQQKGRANKGGRVHTCTACGAEMSLWLDKKDKLHKEVLEDD